MILDPRRLRFLLAVARYGGVLAAADELAVTASAVSQQIAKLEQETGRPLLRRTSSGSVLTAAGQALAEAAEDVERALAVARSRLEQDGAGVSGTVRIGGFQSFLATVLAPALPLWHERHPALRFETVEAEEADLMRALRAGSLDAVVVELDAGESHTPPRGTTDVPLLDEPWKLVVPPGMLRGADVVDLSRLGLPWLSLDPTAASAKAIRRVRRELGGEESAAHTYATTRTRGTGGGRSGRHARARPGPGVPADRRRRDPRHPGPGHASGRAAPPGPPPPGQPGARRRGRPRARGGRGVLLRAFRAMRTVVRNRWRDRAGGIDYKNHGLTHLGRVPPPASPSWSGWG